MPIPDDRLDEIPFYKPPEDAPEMVYLRQRREVLGGYLPHRRQKADERLPVPPLSAFAPLLEPTHPGRSISTTQAYVRALGHFAESSRDRQTYCPDHGG